MAWMETDCKISHKRYILSMEDKMVVLRLLPYPGPRGERREEREKTEKTEEREERGERGERGERREERGERRKRGKSRVERKPLEAGDANLTIMLRWVSINITRSINKQPITTHLSVNSSQLEYDIRQLNVPSNQEAGSDL